MSTIRKCGLHLSLFLSLAAIDAIPLEPHKGAHAQGIAFQEDKLQPQKERLMREISVQILSSTEGSGVIVDKTEDAYTVLTAWHVVAGHTPGEELTLATHDGTLHRLIEGSIEKISSCDMALLRFRSSNNYQIAKIPANKAKKGEQILVGGFPLGLNKFQLEDGKLIANANIGVEDGYQMMYTNYTLPGMSGGPLVNQFGELIGIHGRGELDIRQSRESEEVIKTGLNQGVPISFYVASTVGKGVTIDAASASTADDLIVELTSLYGKNDQANQHLEKADRLVELDPGAISHLLRGRIVLYHFNDYKKAARDFSLAIEYDKTLVNAYTNRAFARTALGHRSALDDIRKRIDITTEIIGNKPNNERAYRDRGEAYADLARYYGGSWDQAIEDTNKAIEINPYNYINYYNKGTYYLILGMETNDGYDFGRSVNASAKAVELNPHYPRAYHNLGAAYIVRNHWSKGCPILRKSAEIGYKMSDDLLKGQFRRCNRY